jgi:hypothetical protein
MHCYDHFRHAAAEGELRRLQLKSLHPAYSSVIAAGGVLNERPLEALQLLSGGYPCAGSFLMGLHDFDGRRADRDHIRVGRAFL